jgi:enoyl-CoA hydratase/carnithine racemase
MAEGRIEIDSGTSELLCEIRDRVALITLNRPEVRAALSDHLTLALRRIVKQCGDDLNVGALLIAGVGAAFCAGGDVKGMGGNTTPWGRGDGIDRALACGRRQETVWRNSWNWTPGSRRSICETKRTGSFGCSATEQNL